MRLIDTNVILRHVLEEVPKKISREDGWAAFQEMREQVQAAGIPKMTLEEINAEISETRRERHERQAATV